MFFLFKNFIKQYRLHRAFKHGLDLVKSGKKEEAFNQFNSLLNQEPDDPYIRRQVLILGKQLNKKVNLP